MRTIETDVVIIGAGTAGLSALRMVERAGKRWVLIEKAAYGTMCARKGCMPSKLLVAAAERAHDVETAAFLGLETTLKVDGPKVMRRLRAERDRFVSFAVRDTEALDETRRLWGEARFTGPRSVQVSGGESGEVEVRFESAVLAVGTVPRRLAIFEPLGDLAISNEELFELEDLPRSVALVGTGAIGLELGQSLARLGVETQFFSEGAYGGLRDPEVHAVARELFHKKLEITEQPIVRIRREGDEAVLVVREGEGEREYRAERVLMATGRVPQLEGMNLDTAGVQLDARGYPEHDPETLQCGESAVFVAGDITGTRALLHEASDDGRTAGRNAALAPKVEPGSWRLPLAIVFSEPNLASVGAAYDPKWAIGEVDYSRQGRARVMGKNEGLVRLYGDRESRQLVGAELCAPRAEHLAHLLAWIIAGEITVDEALSRPFYHPVLEEGLRTALVSLRRNMGR